MEEKETNCVMVVYLENLKKIGRVTNNKINVITEKSATSKYLANELLVFRVEILRYKEENMH